jgi:hypothetical protein
MFERISGHHFRKLMSYFFKAENGTCNSVAKVGPTRVFFRVLTEKLKKTYKGAQIIFKEMGFFNWRHKNSDFAQAVNIFVTALRYAPLFDQNQWEPKDP